MRLTLTSRDSYQFMPSLIQYLRRAQTTFFSAVVRATAKELTHSSVWKARNNILEGYFNFINDTNIRLDIHKIQQAVTGYNVGADM